MGDGTERPRDQAVTPNAAASTDIAAVGTRQLREAFIRLPWSLYADDPNWVPPLLMSERKRIGPVGAASDARRPRSVDVSRGGRCARSPPAMRGWKRR